ncbi:hypothetical protein GCM10027048_14150 [Hymenobacter coalescens]
MLGGLHGCAPATEKQHAAPTGRYEGTLTHRGAEMPVVVNLYQDSVSRRVQVVVRVADTPLYSRFFDSVAYQAPTLAGRLPGGSRLALREEPNFLTGSIWLHDTLRAELVAVRRAPSDLPSYTTARQPGADGGYGLLFTPLDTVLRRPAVLLWPEAGAVGAAFGWADWLVRQGMVVAVAAPEPQSDSVAAPQLRAALQRLRSETRARVDSTQVGVWGFGAGGRAAALAVTGVSPAKPAFLILQGPGLTPADRSWLRQLGRRRLPVLGLYGALDTTVNVRESSQQLRNAVGGRRGSGVKVYQQASKSLLVAAPADSVRRWPQLPADLASSLQEWLGRMRR